MLINVNNRISYVFILYTLIIIIIDDSFYVCRYTFFHDLFGIHDVY